MTVIKKIDFYDVFKGKKVIVVGPSGSLLNDCKNIDVDSYDVVCRLNSHYRMIEKHGNVIGKRLDVLFHALQPYQISEKEVKSWNNMNFHLVARIANPVYLQKVKNFGYNKKVYNIPSKLLSETRRKMKCNPSTGVLAILDAFHYEAKEVHAIGFDFYQTLYQTKKDESFRKKILDNRIGNHNPRKQLAEFKKLMRGNESFFPHGKLKELMK